MDIIGLIHLDQRTMDRAVLPISCSGVGLTSAANVAQSAYLACAAATINAQHEILTRTPSVDVVEVSFTTLIDSYEPVIESFNSSNNSVHTLLDLASLPKIQQLLSLKVHKLKLASHLLTPGIDPREVLMINSSQVQSGQFLHFPELGAFLQNESFVCCVRFRLCMPMFRVPCVCPLCGKHSDVYGDHVTGCTGEGARTKRHDLTKFAFFLLCREASLTPVLEPKNLLLNGDSPADVLLPKGSKGKPSAIDFTIVSALNGPLESILANAEAAKRYQYQLPCDEVGIEFIPFAMTSTGGFGAAAKECINSVATLLSASRKLPKSVCVNRVCSVLSLEVQRAQANAWLQVGSILEAAGDNGLSWL